MAITFNVGGWDRKLRVMLGVILLILPALGFIPEASAIFAYIVGAIAIATGLFRFCPAYALLGFNTCKAPSQNIR